MRRLTPTASAVMILAMTMAACSILKAQPAAVAATGTLQGVVTGPSGPVANAAISVTAADATQHRGVTDANGYYSVAGIPVGPASYSVQASGFARVEGSIVIAADPGPNRQDVSLNPQ